ncbi:glycosyltransferase family 2 protein [Pseudooceanicola aestuarii]|uniref:glycosyltransferase family 2 protein n=1 Tax=Pseudooceanicola aestuarii TaxID=2697319 RepID=UPI0013D82DBE|nr:glycosyltransferase family 2 protein [Pseudooceanicola aestuarii]
MTCKPLITIGITCFNAADTIDRAIASALAQDWPWIEILVVDDASVDTSAERIAAWAGRDKRLRVVRHEVNLGYPSALNTLISAAQGQAIAFFDDDDHSAPDRLRHQYDRLTSHEAKHPAQPVLCYANRLVVEGSQRVLSRAIGRQAPEPHGPAVADFLLLQARARPFTWGQFGSCTLMARVGVLRGLGGFDPGFRRMAEWDLAIRAAAGGAHFIAVDAPLVTQYKTPGDGAEKTGNTPLRYALRLREKHAGILRERGLYRAARAMAHVRFHAARGARGRMRVFAALALVHAPRQMAAPVLGGSRIWRRIRNVISAATHLSKTKGEGRA